MYHYSYRHIKYISYMYVYIVISTGLCESERPYMCTFHLHCPTVEDQVSILFQYENHFQSRKGDGLDCRQGNQLAKHKGRREGLLLVGQDPVVCVWCGEKPYGSSCGNPCTDPP